MQFSIQPTAYAFGLPVLRVYPLWQRLFCPRGLRRQLLVSSCPHREAVRNESDTQRESWRAVGLRPLRSSCCGCFAVVRLWPSLIPSGIPSAAWVGRSGRSARVSSACGRSRSRGCSLHLYIHRKKARGTNKNKKIKKIFCMKKPPHVEAVEPAAGRN